MRQKPSRLAVVLALFLCCQGTGAAEVDEQDLVQGLLARSDAVFSGRLKYQRVTGSRNKDVDPPIVKELVFSASSWRTDVSYPVSQLTIKAQPGVAGGIDLSKLRGNLFIKTVSHGGKSLTYKAMPQLDGKVNHVARVAAGESLRSESLDAPPIFAGTLWFRCTADFIQRHRAMVRVMPDAVVNGISTRVLEWLVRREDVSKAFYNWDALTEKGGRLRVYVAPHLGYALPRIEYLGDGGMVTTSYESSDFKDRGNGMFLPRHCSLQYFGPRGPGFFIDYDLLEISNINGTVADKEFVLEIPAGTIVSDARSGTHSTWFELKDKASIPPDLTDVIALPSLFSWRRTPGWAIAVGVVAGAAALLAVFVLRRRAGRKEPNG